MKKKIITTLLILSLIILGVPYGHSKDYYGDNGLRIRYKFYFKEDSTIRGHYMDSTMCLDIFVYCTSAYICRSKSSG